MSAYAKWLVAIWVVALPFAAHGQQIPSDADLTVWLQGIARVNPDLRAKFQLIDDSYEVVFFPGILGSKLRLHRPSGQEWSFGDDEIPLDGLFYPWVQAKSKETMGTFSATFARFNGWKLGKDVPIYGPGLESLRVALGGKQAKHFPYDWRSDIDALTDDFQSWAIANLSGKRVVLVAHSTGGLVAWNWKNRYLRDDQTDDPKKRRPFQLAGVILLGVPLKGSCEPVRMLIDGYSSPGSSASWDQMATHFVFRNSRSAVFTFPSLFQLMPQYENDASACLGVVDQNGTHPLNHHEVGAWFGDPAGTFGVRRKFPDVAFEQAMKAPLDAYYEQVLKAIDRGKKFRDAFDYDGNEDSVAMFYTADVKMPSAYYYTFDNTWLRPANRSAQSLNGDGRVPEESGSNPGIKNPLFVSRFKTHSEHGALLQDKVFLNFAEDTLKKWLVQVKNLEKYALAIEVEEHRAYARRQKWVMRPVSQFSRLTETDPALAGAVSAVANLNIETIAGTGSEDRIARAKSVAKEFDGKDPTSSVAAAIYSSVEAIAPEENDARSLNRLGLIRFRQARYKEAERYLRRASEIAESKEDPYLTAAIKGQIYYSLGRAREQIKGMEDDARIAFGKSAELGNAEARQRMAR